MANEDDASDKGRKCLEAGMPGPNFNILGQDKSSGTLWKLISLCLLLMLLSFMIGATFRQPATGEAPTTSDWWLLASAGAVRTSPSYKEMQQAWMQQNQPLAGYGSTQQTPVARPFLAKSLPGKRTGVKGLGLEHIAHPQEEPLPKGYGFLIHGDLPYIEQFMTLFWRLYSPESFYAIHLHANSEPAVHEALQNLVYANGPLPNVQILPAICVTWGGPNMVGSTLQLIRNLLEMGEWSHFILLSGTHYPVRPAWYIDGFLRANEGISFLHGTFQNASQWAFPARECNTVFGDDFDKRFYCKFYDDCEGGHERTSLTMEVSLTGPHENGPELLRSLGVSIFSGSQWVLLSREAAQYVVEDPLPCRLYDELYSSSGVADESFFQTAIYNNPALVNKTSPVYNTIVYWTPDGEDECKEKPCELSMANSFRLKKDIKLPGWQGALFARKFDMDDMALYEWVEQELLSLRPKKMPRFKYRWHTKWRFQSRRVEDPLRDNPLSIIRNPVD